MPELFEAVKALGIAGGPVFAYLWWLERKERIESQKALPLLLEKSLNNTHEASTAINAANTAIIALKEMVAQFIRSARGKS